MSVSIGKVMPVMIYTWIYTCEECGVVPVTEVADTGFGQWHVKCSGHVSSRRDDGCQFRATFIGAGGGPRD